jgi:hypothetical protein
MKKITARAREEAGWQLHDMCKDGRLNASELARLLKAGADVNWADSNQHTGLWCASFLGDLRAVKLLLAANVDTSIRNLSMWGGPLFVAAQNGHVACIEALVAAGASMTVKTKDPGMTSLHMAAQMGHPAAAAVLVTAGSNIDAVSDQGSTPLMQAAKFGHAAIVKQFLKRGCNVDARNSYGNTALLLATEERQHACVKLLMRRGGADPRTPSGTPCVAGKTPLELAIAHGAGAKTVRELQRMCSVCDKTQGQIEGKVLSKYMVCRAVYYCSVECQRVDWSKHQLVCEEATTTVTKVTAAAEAAEVAAPHCLCCFKKSRSDGSKLSTCSRCQEARYCSCACQIKDFPRHKKVCCKK